MMARDVQKAQEIGRRIAQARQEAGGMTQRELGELVGVTDRSIIAYEKGEVVPYRLLPKLESALGRTAAWFLYGEVSEANRDLQLEQIMSSIAALEKTIRRLERKLNERKPDGDDADKYWGRR